MDDKHSDDSKHAPDSKHAKEHSDKHSGYSRHFMDESLSGRDSKHYLPFPKPKRSDSEHSPDSKHSHDDKHSGDSKHSPDSKHAKQHGGHDSSRYMAIPDLPHSGAHSDGGAGDSEEWEYGEEDFFKHFFIAQALRLNFNYWFFPGLIAHEMAHVIGCWLAGSRVAKVVLWSPQGGYVIHQRVRGSSSVIISLAPFFLGNILAIFFLLNSFRAFSSGDAVLYAVVSLWLGFSFAIYAFPSMHDIRSSVDSLQRSVKKYASAKGFLGRLYGIIVMPVLYTLYLLVVTLMSIFAAGPGSRVLWFCLLFATIYTGTLGEILARFS